MTADQQSSVTFFERDYSGFNRTHIQRVEIEAPEHVVDRIVRAIVFAAPQTTDFTNNAEE